MNAVLNEGNEYRDLFDRLTDNATRLALTDAPTRITKIRQLLAEIMAARTTIFEACQKELGLDETTSDMNLLMVKSEADFIIKNLEQWMAPAPIQSSLMTLGKKSYIRYEPKGVVLHVSTWNAAVAEAFVIALGAIAAGCPFVLKPSELAPHSAQVIADIVSRCFAEDEFAVLQGGPEVATELLKLPFNHMFYIGGHTVGRIMLRAAAEHFATVTLEMGGKNPVIVDASADIKEAGKKIAWGRVANGGQVCLAPDYALVHESQVSAFVEALKSSMTAFYNPEGKGFQHSAELARIINLRHFDRIQALIDDALAKGATLALGGQNNRAERLIVPTILTNVHEQMKIMQDEIFGPVICIVPFSDRDQAIATIRRRAKPLASYIFAKDRAAIDWWMARTTSGSTVVNHNLIQSGTNANLPFGGVNASGQGRIGGRYTFLECSNARAVVEEGPPVGDPDIMFPPYSDKYKKMIAQMLGMKFVMPDGGVNVINGIIRFVSLFRRS